MAANNPQDQPTKQTGTFVVEVDCGRNRTYASATFRTKWRGAFSLNNIERGHNVGSIMANMRPFPGLHIEVNLKTAVVRVLDPITRDQLKQINLVLNDPNAGPVRTDAKRVAVETVIYDLGKDADKFKTFLVEVRRGLDEGMFKPVKGGDFPTMEQIDKLPGQELNDPFNNSAIKPKYKHQQAKYVEQLQRQE